MPQSLPRCDVLPLPDHQASFCIGGVERLRWHFDPTYPRPFFYPLTGPAGVPLTRMGHPGAPNHDHHRSIWFAHDKVLGISFWSDGSKAQIRQKQWLCYQDGDEWCAMAVILGWYDGHDPRELLQQELIVVVSTGPKDEARVELQSTFRPTADALEFGKTNFGFLAVRVAKSISEYFGGGLLTNSDGQEHEAAIFGKPAKWMDYSGLVARDHTEGITYFDHTSNPGHPVSWHVREDGWMGAAPCLKEGITTTKKDPLRLRYLLEAHSGKLDPKAANELFDEFAATKPLEVVKAGVKHTEYVIRRVGEHKEMKK
jgi:hypothetical protein